MLFRSSVFVSDTQTNEITDTNLWITSRGDLGIARRFMTNSLMGTLTVTLSDNTWRIYSVADGTQIYPPLVKPLMKLEVKDASPTLKVFGGIPFAKMSVVSYTDFNCPPTRTVVDLDNVGSMIWSPPTTSSQFFRVEYEE